MNELCQLKRHCLGVPCRRAGADYDPEGGPSARGGSVYSVNSYIETHNFSVRSGTRFSSGDRSVDPKPSSGGVDPDRSRRGRWLSQSIALSSSHSREGSIKSRSVHHALISLNQCPKWVLSAWHSLTSCFQMLKLWICSSCPGSCDGKISRLHAVRYQRLFGRGRSALHMSSGYLNVWNYGPAFMQLREQRPSNLACQYT